MPSRYGTGELYGLDFIALSPARIRELSSAPFKSQVCPFKPAAPGGPPRKCNKKGGVCSLRRYEQDSNGQTLVTGEPVTTCPNRFLEGNVVSQWAGKTLLGTANPVVISEMPFLMGEI
jgi:Restriction endonuclease NotI